MHYSALTADLQVRALPFIDLFTFFGRCPFILSHGSAPTPPGSAPEEFTIIIIRPVASHPGGGGVGTWMGGTLYRRGYRPPLAPPPWLRAWGGGGVGSALIAGVRPWGV